MTNSVEPRATKSVVAGGLEWQVIDTGLPHAGAPTLVLLPGTLGTANIFDRQIAALAPEARVVALTYPVEENLQPMMASLVTLLDQLGVDRFHVLGSSLGGFVVQWLAHRIPDRIETAFIANSLVDPVPVRRRMPPIEVMKAMAPDEHKAVILKSVAGWEEPEPVFAELKQILIRSGEMLGGEALRARVLALQESPAVPDLKLPVSRIVVIESEDDPLIGEEVRASVRARYPGAEVKTFPLGGHYPYVTRADEYTALIRRRLGLPA